MWKSVFKKWIQHLGVFNFKPLLLAKICVYIPNIAFSNVKLSYLNQIKPSLQAKTVRGLQGMDFFIMDKGLIFWSEAMVYI